MIQTGLLYRDITMEASWEILINSVKELHINNPILQNFCPFPNDLISQNVEHFHIEACDLIKSEKKLNTNQYKDLRDKITEKAGYAHWRQTYKGTAVESRFLNQFGCYCLIGVGGPYTSNNMRAWVVYMPPNLYYPWHYHPAEELYFCIAGEAIFKADGQEDRLLGEGGIAQHSSNQSHAMQTNNKPVLAYVVWRNEFDVLPKLTHDDAK
jgi:quercetin dioxygenase-like cupin family protein